MVAFSFDVLLYSFNIYVGNWFNCKTPDFLKTIIFRDLYQCLYIKVELHLKAD